MSGPEPGASGFSTEHGGQCFRPAMGSKVQEGAGHYGAPPEADWLVLAGVCSVRSEAQVGYLRTQTLRLLPAGPK